jgi:hypothetical protein
VVSFVPEAPHNRLLFAMHFLDDGRLYPKLNRRLSGITKANKIINKQLSLEFLSNETGVLITNPMFAVLK